MRQGTANLNRMIRKNSQIKWLSEQLKERRQEATGTCGGGTFSRMDSERKTAKVEGGHTAGTAEGDDHQKAELAAFHRDMDGSSPGEERRRPTAAQMQTSEWTGWWEALKSRNNCRQPQLGGKEQEMFKVLGEIKYEAVSRREGKWPRQTTAEWVPGNLKAGHELSGVAGMAAVRAAAWEREGARCLCPSGRVQP